MNYNQKCPFCEGTVRVVVCDRRGNYPKEEGYEQNPSPRLGLGYILCHSEQDAIGECPIANDPYEDMLGRIIYDSPEEAVKVWNKRRTERRAIQGRFIGANCKDIGFGTYNCAYNIMLPWLVKDPTSVNEPPKPLMVSVDKCLLPEILNLWEMGIKTTGCCCGHGKQQPFIGVNDEYIDKMKQMGYEVYYNPCRPDDEDSFIPKTMMRYENADNRRTV